jgi:hypothetical protein
MRMQAVELVALVRDRRFAVVCFCDLPPSSPSKTRYLVRRLRAALPELRIAVGRWAPPALADERPQTLVDAGANHVGSLLAESRTYLGSLLELPRLSETVQLTCVSAVSLEHDRGTSSVLHPSRHVTKHRPPASNLICRYCHLESPASHASMGECVNALQREKAWLKERLRHRPGDAAAVPERAPDPDNGAAMSPRIRLVR